MALLGIGPADFARAGTRPMNGAEAVKKALESFPHHKFEVRVENEGETITFLAPDGHRYSMAILRETQT